MHTDLFMWGGPTNPPLLHLDVPTQDPVLACCRIAAVGTRTAYAYVLYPYRQEHGT